MSVDSNSAAPNTLVYESALLQSLLVTGRASIRDAVQWADAWILKLDVLPDWLEHVSLAKSEPHRHELVETLARVSDAIDRTRLADDIQIVFARDLAAKRATPDAVIEAFCRLLDDINSPLARTRTLSSDHPLWRVQLVCWQFEDERAYGSGHYVAEGARVGITQHLAAFVSRELPAPLANLHSFKF